MKIKLSLGILCVLFLSSCATIFSGSSQNINIKVVNENNDIMDNVNCNVTDAGGAEYVTSSNPGIVHVRRGVGNLIVSCKKDGYRQRNLAVGDSFNTTTIVNVLFWPGFIVDGMSGAYKKYPSHYIVNMEKVNK